MTRVKGLVEEWKRVNNKRELGKILALHVYYIYISFYKFVFININENHINICNSCPILKVC